MNRRTTSLLLMAGLAGTINLAQAGILNIPVLAAGDGYWHDEVGGSYDFFDATSGNVSAHYQFWGTSDTVSYNTGYAQFDLSSLVGVAFTSASLNLYLNGSYLTAPTPDAGAINHRSDASSATGSASQRLAGNELVAAIAGGLSQGWISVDITGYLQNDLLNNYAWAAFSFNPNTTGSYSDRYAGFSFASAESGLGAYISVATGSAQEPQPATPAPAPGMLTLLAAGSLLLAQRRRNRKD